MGAGLSHEDAAGAAEAGAAAGVQTLPPEGGAAATLPFVANVSWPRSGHGLLIRILRALLAERFSYCEFYRPRAKQGSSCCGRFPCTRPGISMTKQHDAALAPGAPLVVQIRSFVPAAVSHFEYALSAGSVEDSAASFRAFALAQVAPYRRFTAKWVAPPRPGRVVVPTRR